jgi:hypothetical protein
MGNFGSKNPNCTTQLLDKKNASCSAEQPVGVSIRVILGCHHAFDQLSCLWDNSQVKIEIRDLPHVFTVILILLVYNTKILSKPRQSSCSMVHNLDFWKGTSLWVKSKPQ